MRTLKDFGTKKVYRISPISIGYKETSYTETELKKEVIKWLKKDMFDLENSDIGVYNIIERWIERFNLTDEDLKVKHKKWINGHYRKIKLDNKIVRKWVDGYWRDLTSDPQTPQASSLATDQKITADKTGSGGDQSKGCGFTFNEFSDRYFICGRTGLCDECKKNRRKKNDL